MSSIVNVLRLAAMGAVCFCSIIVLGIGAYILNLSAINGLSYTFNAFAVAVAVLTLVMIPPLLIIGLVRKGAVFNYVAVELAVLGTLWVFWLAAASYIANQIFFLSPTCDYIDTLDIAVCHELQAMHAFSWLNWLILTGYWPFLLIMSLVQQSRGNSVWTKPVNDVNMFAPRVIAVVTPGGVYPPQQQPVMYAPQPMQQQPQVVYPPGAPGVAYPPVPAQPGYAPTQSPQLGYTPTLSPQPGYTPTLPPQQPHMGGGGYPQI